MLSRKAINLGIILGFMVLVGLSLARSIQTASVLALILSITSLGAGVYFIYLLSTMPQPQQAEEEVS